MICESYSSSQIKNAHSRSPLIQFCSFSTFCLTVIKKSFSFLLYFLVVACVKQTRTNLAEKRAGLGWTSSSCQLCVPRSHCSAPHYWNCKWGSTPLGWSCRAAWRHCWDSADCVASGGCSSRGGLVEAVSEVKALVLGIAALNPTGVWGAAPRWRR